MSEEIQPPAASSGDAGFERDLLRKVVCPVDHSALAVEDETLVCADGGHRYRRGEHGFLELAEPGSVALTIESTSGEYVHIQESGSAVRVFAEYLKPWLSSVGADSVLDAGCGLGVGTMEARRSGFAAIGTDLRGVAEFWQKADRPPAAFVVSDVGSLPFADGSFDVAIALGVIEHIGTTTGHSTLAADWREQRVRFASELKRVVRPGGRILIACPNKRFPIDIQHGPGDSETLTPLRSRLFQKVGLNVHRTWGAYHLAGYRDLYRWFGRSAVTPLSLDGYFGFSALERPGVTGLMGRAAKFWIRRLPVRLRSTALNPYLLAEIAV